MTGSPPISLPSAERQPAGVLLVGRRIEQLAQIDGLGLEVGQLDADDVAPGHDRDAHRDRAHRAGDVVGEADDARRLDAGRRLQLVERHHRARAAPARSGRARRNPRAPLRACRAFLRSASSSTVSVAACRRLGQQVERRQDRLAVGAGRAPAAARCSARRPGRRRLAARQHQPDQPAGRRRRLFGGGGAAAGRSGRGAATRRTAARGARQRRDAGAAAVCGARTAARRPARPRAPRPAPAIGRRRLARRRVAPAREDRALSRPRRRSPMPRPEAQASRAAPRPAPLPIIAPVARRQPDDRQQQQRDQRRRRHRQRQRQRRGRARRAATGRSSTQPIAPPAPAGSGEAAAQTEQATAPSSSAGTSSSSRRGMRCERPLQQQAERPAEQHRRHQISGQPDALHQRRRRAARRHGRENCAGAASPAVSNEGRPGCRSAAPAAAGSTPAPAAAPSPSQQAALERRDHRVPAVDRRLTRWPSRGRSRAPNCAVLGIPLAPNLVIRARRPSPESRGAATYPRYNTRRIRAKAASSVASSCTIATRI